MQTFQRCLLSRDSAAGINRWPLVLYAALLSQWRYALATDKLTVAMEIANRVYSLADGLRNTALIVGAHRALAATLFYKGDFEFGLQHAQHGVQIWRSAGRRLQ
jgi:hypothetical protein